MSSSFTTDGKGGHEMKIDKVEGVMPKKNKQKVLWLMLPDDICLISSS